MYTYMYTYMCIYILSSWVAVSWKAIFMGFLAVHDIKKIPQNIHNELQIVKFRTKFTMMPHDSSLLSTYLYMYTICVNKSDFGLKLYR